MVTHSSPRPRRWRAFAVLALVAVCGGSALALTATASPVVRHNVARFVGHVSGSSVIPQKFEKTAGHGYIPTGETVELDNDSLPALANLDPALLDAARQAAAAAQADGVHVAVTSGWRSAAYQQWLLDRAVSKYGTADEAAKWVSTPDTSKHVSGDAIDIGPFDATLWMQSNSTRFGLCQIYANELWHYELASNYGGSCPVLRENAAG